MKICLFPASYWEYKWIVVLESDLDNWVVENQPTLDAIVFGMRICILAQGDFVMIVKVTTFFFN